TPSPLRQVDTQKAVNWAETKLNLKLAENQKAAVTRALQEKILVITGGPGTGKSTITNAILLITQELTSRLLLAAPTGRAAKRMAEITKKPAKTIHSLLEVNFKEGGFKRDRENPLECDFIVIDESSMIDTSLMFYLLRAIPSHARVLFIGDINQLPSVGPGNVLKDLIASKLIPTVELNEIFRQAQGSAIIQNAHRINKGSMPELRNQATSDFFFIPESSPENILNQIVALVTVRLPHKYKLQPLKDIQVLAPMRKGVIGFDNLNQALQQALNPNKPSIARSGRRLSIGDKVMQIRNNYQKEVFNGDIGFIEAIDDEEEVLSIRIDDRLIEYEYSELEEITHAYAVSIHKFQGSETPCVIIPVDTSHFILLTRNLLYTGVTRGKSLVVLVGSEKAIAMAVRNNAIQKRHTGLKHFLLSAI
ncbi:MAG: ATP-dependent RecD-like DNA helicase, partial [Parachlamydiaceae bacterium]